MDNIIIRQLTLNDYTEYLHLITNFRKTEFTKEKFVEIFHEIMKSSEIWVIEKDNKLIGTGTIIYEYKYIFDICILAHIEDVCIQTDVRNSGYGKILMHKLIEEAKKKECYKITLDCMENNVPFYEKCGFEKRGHQMTVFFGKT